jgi:hypothetical protein
MGLVFSYGDYIFNPKPLFTIGKEYIKTPSHMGLGSRYTMTINGHIIPDTGTVPFGDPKAGLQKVFSGVEDIHRAFDNDFKLLHLHCEATADSIISGYPRITSFDVEHASDNYVIRADYTIVLDLPSLKGSGFDPVGPIGSGYSPGCGVDDLDFGASGIISYSDEFTVEFLDERLGGDLNGGGLDLGEIPSIFSIQRSITAQGDSMATADSASVCDPYLHPWERAKAFIEPRLGIPPEASGLTGLLCPAGSFLNNFRSINVNKTEGTFSVNQSYITVTGGLAYEDFQINTSQTLGEPYVTVTVDGTVNGLTDITYSGLSTDVCPPSGVPKFLNALSHWSGSISGGILGRAQQVYGVTELMSGHVGWESAAVPYGGAINSLPLTKTVGYNPIAGTVTYSYTYDNRPVHCYEHAIIEDITFSTTEPDDVFASLTVLGKISGPLYQTIGTVGHRTKDMSINAVLPMETDCCILTGGSCTDFNFFVPPASYDALVLQYEAILDATYAQVFVTSSSKTWEPKTGRFTLNQSWTVGKC